MFQTLAGEFTNTFSQVPLSVAIARLFAAMLLGGVIGLEREWHEKPAGLRTHMLVSLAACLFIVLGRELAHIDFVGEGEMQIDPLRLIEATTQGVAFLAAGIIFTARGKVQNITTGASLWLSGAIGVACGAGQVPLAALATVMVLLVLAVLRLLESALGLRKEDTIDRKPG